MRLITRCFVQLDVTNVVDEDDVGETVYASDDGTATLVAGGNTAIGVVERHITGSTCIVKCEAVPERSL